MEDANPDMSFLEMLDVVNERLTLEGGDPIAFEHDCREGICGSCGLMINGQAHGPLLGTATCQLHMRSFQDGDTIVVEPWRAAAFPVIKDLVVDRSSFDRIIEAGGYITVAPGAAPDANLTLIPKGCGRRGLRRRGMYRLRSLRGGLPKRRGAAFHRGQGGPSGNASPGATGAVAAGGGHGGNDGGLLRVVHQPW